MTSPEPVVTAAEPEVPWVRLDARMIAVDAFRVAVALLPLGLAVALRNADAAGVESALRTIAAIGIVSAVADLLRWATTIYRVTPTRVEVRAGVLTRRHVSVPRDRIRRVVATAKLRHRIFGLTVVTIATGDRPSSNEDVLRLDAVTSRQAADLRQRLLGTHAGPAPTADEGTGTDGTVLATLDWRWAPYTLLSITTLAVPALAVGGLFQALQSAGVDPDDVANDDRLIGRARDLSLASGIALAAVAVIVVGVVGALGLFVEAWWGYRLVREPGSRLRIHRGLLTSRSLALDESRLRGVEVAEPLALRIAAGARLHAVTTGEVESGGSPGVRADALLPPAPISEVQRVAAAVLDTPSAPTARRDLRPHPRAAARRRLVKAVAVGASAWLTTGVIAVAGGGVPLAAWTAPAAVSLVAVANARDAYRSLGHALDARYVVIRRGSLVRRTVALQRTGVIGWNVRSSLFQRRLGLATVVATTAAGRGSYALADVDAVDGLRFAEAAAPGILGPFFTDREPVPTDDAEP